jgi:hypothetical protein
MAEISLNNGCIALHSRNIGGRMAAVWLSTGTSDPDWDDFLQASTLGHYEQSSLWAQAKRCEGWRPIRAVLTLDGQISGGAQILIRRTRLGEIGYINRGPVIAPEDNALIDFLTEMLILTSKTKNLQGLVIRPPDESGIGHQLWTRHGFLTNDVLKFDSATLTVDLSIGIDAIKKRMRRSLRRTVRQSQERGIKVREGGEHEIGTFFALVRATCQRQGKKPQPSTENAFLEVWKAFHPSGRATLYFAEYEGEVLAGLFCLYFGGRVTAWRKGWSGAQPERHPNDALWFEVIQSAHYRGYKILDFAGLERDIAISLFQGELHLEKQKMGKDFANLSFGGTPRLLPDSQLYISNPAFRFAYRVGRLGKATRLLQRIVSGCLKRGLAFSATSI